jgi:meso-butanediol dehydrogenase/(S,S)-butanediol dehydrogenase/diacetyl reductase
MPAQQPDMRFAPGGDVPVVVAIGDRAADNKRQEAVGSAPEMARTSSVLPAPAMPATPNISSARTANEMSEKIPSGAVSFSTRSTATLGLQGIGALTPSQMLADSGNSLTPEELSELGAAGAVGDMGLRFFDAEGKQVRSSCDARVLGADLPQVQRFARSVGVAGGRAEGFVADVTDKTQVVALYDAAEAAFGEVNVSVRNAGIITIRRLEEPPVDEWRAMMDVNTTGVFLCCQEAVARMRRHGRGGRLINTASGQARQGFIYKPGELMAEWVRNIPMGRAGSGEDVAGLVAFLASEDDAYVTGQTVNADGGLIMS